MKPIENNSADSSNLSAGRRETQLQERWDRQLAADAASGRLDALFDELVAEDENGMDLDAFLDDQKLR